MEALDGAAAIELCTDLLALSEEVAAGVVPSRTRQSARHWQIWCKFCADLVIHPGLPSVRDPVPYLQLFARRYRDGRLTPSGRPVRSRTVEDAVRSVGQAFSALGAPDPRESAPNRIDFRIQRQLRGYKRGDPAPARVRPIPMASLREAQRIADSTIASARERALADLMWIAFYYLLRPGEYLKTTSEHAFTLSDILVRHHQTEYKATHIPIALLPQITYAGLTFNEQKNGVKGEVVGLTPSGDSQACAVRALGRRVHHLRIHNASPSTKLYTYYDAQHRQHHLGSTQLTEYLRLACQITGQPPNTVSARALRATGATALLQGHVPIQLIQLLGRWRSDEVFRYLHTQSQPLMAPLATTMLQHYT